MADGLQSNETWRQPLCPREIVVSDADTMAAIQVHCVYSQRIEQGAMHRSAGLEYRATYNLDLFEHIRALIFACIVERSGAPASTGIAPEMIAAYVIASEPTMPYWPNIDELCREPAEVTETMPNEFLTDQQIAALHLGRAFIGAYHYAQGFIAQAEAIGQPPLENLFSAA